MISEFLRDMFNSPTQGRKPPFVSMDAVKHASVIPRDAIPPRNPRVPLETIVANRHVSRDYWHL